MTALEPYASRDISRQGFRHYAADVSSFSAKSKLRGVNADMLLCLRSAASPSCRVSLCRLISSPPNAAAWLLWLWATQNRANAAIPATTAITLPPTMTVLAAPLKVVAGAVVEEVEEVEEEEDEEDAVDAMEAVAGTVVELPTGKGAGVTVVEVAGGATGSGVVEVEKVEVVLVLVLLEVLEVDEVVEVVPGVLAMGVAPEPWHGKVTM